MSSHPNTGLVELIQKAIQLTHDIDRTTTNGHATHKRNAAIRDHLRQVLSLLQSFAALFDVYCRPHATHTWVDGTRDERDQT